MAQPKIRVRSKLTGDVALIAPSALKHFPDYERVDAPEAAPADTPLPPAAAVERPKTTSRAAAKNDEE
jgi:hypothetical protein